MARTQRQMHDASVKVSSSRGKSLCRVRRLMCGESIDEARMVGVVPRKSNDRSACRFRIARSPPAETPSWTQRNDRADINFITLERLDPGDAYSVRRATGIIQGFVLQMDLPTFIHFLSNPSIARNIYSLERGTIQVQTCKSLITPQPFSRMHHNYEAVTFDVTQLLTNSKLFCSVRRS
jgi:hypothetical protein